MKPKLKPLSTKHLLPILALILFLSAIPLAIFLTSQTQGLRRSAQTTGEYGDTDGCFLAGTQVTLADGSTKNIEHITSGELVLSFNHSGELQAYEVLEVDTKHRSYYHQVLLADDTLLQVTDNHPLYMKSATYQGWGSINPKATFKESRMQVAPLTVGAQLLRQDSSWTKVTSITRVDQPVPVYNLKHVQGSHSFFAEGILVHNKLISSQLAEDGFDDTVISAILEEDTVQCSRVSDGTCTRRPDAELNETRAVSTLLTSYNLNDPDYINGLSDIDFYFHVYSSAWRVEAARRTIIGSPGYTTGQGTLAVIEFSMQPYLKSDEIPPLIKLFDTTYDQVFRNPRSLRPEFLKPIIDMVDKTEMIAEYLDEDDDNLELTPTVELDYRSTTTEDPDFNSLPVSWLWSGQYSGNQDSLCGSSISDSDKQCYGFSEGYEDCTRFSCCASNDISDSGVCLGTKWMGTPCNDWYECSSASCSESTCDAPDLGVLDAFTQNQITQIESHGWPVLIDDIYVDANLNNRLAAANDYIDLRDEFNQDILQFLQFRANRPFLAFLVYGDAGPIVVQPATQAQPLIAYTTKRGDYYFTEANSDYPLGDIFQLEALILGDFIDEFNIDGCPKTGCTFDSAAEGALEKGGIFFDANGNPTPESVEQINTLIEDGVIRDPAHTDFESVKAELYDATQDNGDSGIFYDKDDDGTYSYEAGDRTRAEYVEENFSDFDAVVDKVLDGVSPLYQPPPDE